MQRLHHDQGVSHTDSARKMNSYLWRYMRVQIVQFGMSGNLTGRFGVASCPPRPRRPCGPPRATGYADPGPGDRSPGVSACEELGKE